MNRKKLTALVVILSFAAMIFAACDMTSNTNYNANGNRAAANMNANTRADDRGPSREEFEKDKTSFEKQAKDLGRKIGQGADDLWIWTKTRSVLAATDDLRDSTINVDVDNNVVTLSGNVPNEAQKSKAEQVARGVEGVKNVTNNIQVGATGSSGNSNRAR